MRHLQPREAGQLLRAAPLFDGPLDPLAAARYLRERANHVWLAYRDGRPVGFLRGTELLQVETRRPQFFVYEIAVAERHHRSGVGRSLIEAMIAFVRRRGHEEAFVFTSPNNRAAVRLYRSTGAITETDADRMFVYLGLQRGRSRPEHPRARRAVSAPGEPTQRRKGRSGSTGI